MHLSKEEQIQYKHYCDLIRMANQRNFPVYSQFASLNERELAYTAMESYYGRKVAEGTGYLTYGGYEDAERRMICFFPENTYHVPVLEDFPLSCVIVSPANKRYCDTLSHRDYLGTLMNLGIERDQIGDILVKKEENAVHELYHSYIFCKKDKVPLLSEITRIKHTTVTVSEVLPQDFHWKPSFKEITGSISSLRLDAVIAVITRQSRSRCISLIQENQVYINGRLCTENAKKLKDGDILSVRGVGKYVLQEPDSISRKGRYHITIKQYI